MEESDKDAWRYARQQIAEYENHLLEKQLQIKEAEAALDAESEYKQVLQEELSMESKRVNNLNVQANQQREILLGLHKSSKCAENRILHLREQQALLCNDISQLTEKAEMERIAFAKHVSEETDFTTAVLDHFHHRSPGEEISSC
eukprot:jgi/Botrbrau1/16017/Bobra.0353s0012.1